MCDCLSRGITFQNFPLLHCSFIARSRDYTFRIEWIRGKHLMQVGFINSNVACVSAPYQGSPLGQF
jgi:hypothetical protein